MDAHRDDPEFGYRFLAGEAAEAGEVMCERTAWRICQDNQWWSVFGKKRAKNGKRPGPPVHDDLVQRDFTADDVNELWLTDITEHWTDEGKLYLCAIKDAFSGRIVGYSMSDRMKARLAVNALANAATRRGDVAGCIVHSDRGSQGGFNRSSQHLDFGGVRAWPRETGARRRATRQWSFVVSGVLTGR